MTNDDSLGHEHSGFAVPEDFTDPAGRLVDHALLGKFVGAAFDGCLSCQDALLTLLVDDAATCARLVELACITTHSMMGGLPDSMTTHSMMGGLPDSMTTDGVPGPSSPEFRRLARAGMDGQNDAMFAECAEMGLDERRSAANTAADTIVGNLHFHASQGW